jgi:hypothetical protein
MDVQMNLFAEHLLAEFAWEKVRFAKRLIGKQGLRAALPDAWHYGLMHLNPTRHVPESVRDDFNAFSRFMRAALAGGRSFHESTSDVAIEEAAWAFWKLYDAVTMWYTRLNERVNQQELRTQ